MQPICLPSKDSKVTIEPNSAWVTGWGAVNQTLPFSRKLREVKVPFINSEACIKDYDEGWINQTIMICAGRGQKDSCQGDSGGPLVVKSKHGAWFQYGITSFGIGCAEKEHPGVYARVSTFCSFIKRTTKGAVSCRNPDARV